MGLVHWLGTSMGSFLCLGSKGQVAKITLKMKLTLCVRQLEGKRQMTQPRSHSYSLERQAPPTGVGGGRGLLSKPQSANGTHIAFER